MADLEELQKNSSHDTMVDAKDLERLPPAERIRALKHLEEDRRKEIKDAEEMIRKSEREIEVAETVRKIPLPQMRSIDPSTLFSKEEKRIFETHHQVRLKGGDDQVATAPISLRRQQQESLEDTVAGTPIKKDDQSSQFQYGKKLEEALHMAYKTLTEMSQKVGDKGYVNPAEKDAIDFYKNKIEDIHDALGHHPEDQGAIGLVYGGLEMISEMERKMGYAKQGGQGGNPKYRH